MKDQFALAFSSVIQNVAFGCVWSAKEYLQNEDMLTEMWYSQHEQGNLSVIDTFYNKAEYPRSLYYCWHKFTRKNVNVFVDKWLQRQEKSLKILDYHAGLGIGSAQLAWLMPKHDVFAHVAVKEHFDIATEIKRVLKLSNFHVINSLEKADCVVAFEVFEHFSEPEIFLDKVLQATNCKYLLNQSSFSIKAPGHFLNYKFGNNSVPQKQAGRKFIKLIKQRGWVDFYRCYNETRPFNGTPAVYHKILDETEDNMSYHKKQITKGILGQSSKIAEELEELVDAETQGNKILAHCELSDLYGALEACAFNYGLSMEDLKQMADATKSAFLDGSRK